MRKFIGLILLAVPSVMYGQYYGAMNDEIRADTAYAKQRFEYINNINPGDTMCSNAVKRARKDAKDTLYFLTWEGSFGWPLRYERELEEIVETYGLKYGFEYGSDVVFKGQTQGCYKDYMDGIIFKKFGNEFKSKLHLAADSIFIARHYNDTINPWDCDKRATFDERRIYSDGIDLEVDLPIKAVRKEWTTNGQKMFAVYRAFMDIDFTIDKKGSVSTFRLLEFVPQMEENKAFKDQLWRFAIDEIKMKYSKWTPASIRGVVVNSFSSLRVQFKSKNLK